MTIIKVDPSRLDDLIYKKNVEIIVSGIDGELAVSGWVISSRFPFKVLLIRERVSETVAHGISVDFAGPERGILQIKCHGIEVYTEERIPRPYIEFPNCEEVNKFRTQLFGEGHNYINDPL